MNTTTATTIPARFKGLDVVFNADSLYTQGDLQFPVFNCPRGMITGILAHGSLVTSTQEEEQQIRRALEAVIAFKSGLHYQSTCPSGYDPMVALVFNGSSPEEAYAKIQEGRRRERDKASARWLKEQEGFFGQYIWASGACEFARVGILIAAKLDENRDRVQVVRMLESGETEEIHNPDQSLFLSEEVVVWAQEVARIASRQPVPSALPEGYSDYHGIDSDIPFPDMSPFTPLGEHSDQIESVRILFGHTPQVKIKTRYMGLIFGGESGDGFTDGSISLDADRINPVGRAVVVKGCPPYLTTVPARVRNPRLTWHEAQIEVRFGWSDGVTRQSQAIRPKLASVSTAGTIHPDGIFVYSWSHDYPAKVPAEPGAAQKAAQEWAAMLGISK